MRRSSVSDFIVTIGSASHFTLAVDSSYPTPTPAEARYLAALAKILKRLAGEVLEPAELAARLDDFRNKQYAALREDATAFSALAAGPDRDRAAEQFADRALWLEGAYHERRGRMVAVPFRVELEGSPATDIVIQTYDVVIPEEKLRFKGELDKVGTVLKAILGDKGEESGWLDKQKQKVNAWKLDDYLKSLRGIAHIGLAYSDRSQTAFAMATLNAFKDEVVAREASSIKNAYVFVLGVWAALAIAASLGAYWVLDWYAFLPTLPQANFLWLWAGAAAGAWLSFSIRRVSLSFDDLALLEADRLKPAFRILFVIVLSTIVGLTFWTGMITIAVGAFNTDFRVPGTRDVALLIGAFCGLSERSMSSAVARRAEDFAGCVGGAQGRAT